MKKHARSILRILLLVSVWRWGLVAVEYIAVYLWGLRATYLGLYGWANFDGVHYASIARAGYGVIQHAFFPVYPLLLRIVSQHAHLSAEMAGMLISYISTASALCLFYLLFAETNGRKALRAVYFLLLFPTGFYLTAVYTEGLFFLLSVAVFYAASRKRWLIAGIIGGIASATRPYGVLLFPAMLIEYAATTRKKTLHDYGSLLLIPAGLVSYMVYLNRLIGDPFAFIHALPAFGTGRETELILLPQVMWRYIKIFMTVNPTDYVYAIALLEFFVLILFFALLVQAYISRMKVSFIVYSAGIILIPALTGTLTSLPRYILSAFPLFFVLASMDNKYVRLLTLLVFSTGLIVYTSAFLRGHFVA